MGYDTEGKMTSVGFSGTYSVSLNPQTNRYQFNRVDFPTWQWSYDALGMPYGLKVWGAGSSQYPIIQNAAYNAAGQLTSYQRPTQFDYDTSVSPILIDWVGRFETISLEHNQLGQLTKQYGQSYAPTNQYNFSATQNDGRIQSRYDTIVGPYGYAIGDATTSYVYDTLGRLTSATSSSATSSYARGQSFVYDPFGNLLQQNVTSGSAPAMNLTVDPNTNRINMSGFVYDAAGNLTQTPNANGTSNTYAYDSENRLVKANGTSYFYGSSGNCCSRPCRGRSIRRSADSTGHITSTRRMEPNWRR